MKYKFNPIERAVGIFLMISIVGSLSIGAVLAIKKNWFEDKLTFKTYVPTADNIREGSSVLMSGLKVGKIDEIELDASRKIRVTFSVLKKYQRQMTQGTQVKFTRPFVIGDKILTLVQGPEQAPLLASGTILPLTEQLDLIEVLSGKGLDATIAKFDHILTNLEETTEKTSTITKAVSEDKMFKQTLEHLHSSALTLRKNLPQSSQQAQQTIANLQELSARLKEATPESSKKLMELLNESVVTLKSIQKNYFLRDHVKAVKEEMNKPDSHEAARLPASAK